MAAKAIGWHNVHQGNERLWGILQVRLEAGCPVVAAQDAALPVGRTAGVRRMRSPKGSI